MVCSGRENESVRRAYVVDDPAGIELRKNFGEMPKQIWGADAC